MLTRTLIDLPIVIKSLGLKTVKAIPPASLYLDCRSLVDPSGSGLTGDNTHVQTSVMLASAQAVKGMIDQTLHALTHVRARRKHKPDPFDEPFEILCMCAWGIHRSVAMKYILLRSLLQHGYKNVKVIK